MRARHRVSKLLLLPRSGLPRQHDLGRRTHRHWLAQQRFEHVGDRAGLHRQARRCRRALSPARRRSKSGSRGWPTTGELVADRRRLRSFRGIDTLTALMLASRSATSLASSGPRSSPAGSGWSPHSSSPGRAAARARSPRPAPRYARRLLVEAAWHYSREPRIGATLTEPPGGPARPRPADRLARPAPPLPPRPAPARARQAQQRRNRRGRQGTGGFLWAATAAELTPTNSSPARSGRRAKRCRHARNSLWAARTGYARS